MTHKAYGSVSQGLPFDSLLDLMAGHRHVHTYVHLNCFNLNSNIALNFTSTKLESQMNEVANKILLKIRSRILV